MLLRSFTRHLLRASRTTEPWKHVDVAVCIDIECTCDSPIQIEPMEIIELACLKIDLTKESQSALRSGNPTNHPVFHSFVRPIVNPELTPFCQELTGITQQMVDRSETIDMVVPKLLQWMKDENLVDSSLAQKRKFAFASCGNFDMKVLTPIIKELLFNEERKLPNYFNEWINVKKTFVNHKKEWPKTLYHMVELLGLDPDGRPHTALDDCKNLAKVVECLHQDECVFRTTSRL